MAGLIAVFADHLIVLFSGEDADMCYYGALCIRLQCLALPIHAWVAVVNMFCTGLGNAVGAFLLATARQGSCFIPLLYPFAYAWNAIGICSVQAAADVLTLALAIPMIIYMQKKIRLAERSALSETIS